MKRLENGFTLIELMVTVTIAVVLVTVAIPSLSSVYDKVRSSNSIDSIENSFTFARSQAVSLGVRVTVCPLSGSTCNTNWINGYSIFIDNAPFGSKESTDTILKEIGAFNTNDFIKSSFLSFSYTPDGMSTNSASNTINYCPTSKTSNDSKGFSLSVSGRLQTITTSVNCS
jgi:prepilin-type N-terminal cleavage/methylation domain-containing protein